MSCPVLFGVDHLREVSVLHSLILLTEMTLKLRGNLASLRAERQNLPPHLCVHVCVFGVEWHDID